MNREELIRASVFVVAGALIGSSATFLITRQVLIKKYRDIAEEEIESVKDIWARQNKVGKYACPREAASALVEQAEEVKAEAAELSDVVEDLGYASTTLQKASDVAEEVIEDIVESSERDVRNIFETTEQYKPEASLPGGYLADRNIDEPFVISVAEYMDDDTNNEKLTYMYYTVDDTLTDESDEIIPDIEGTVSRVNLSRFGEASSNPNTVYIRNERLGIDYEVVRNNNSYQSVVLNITD